MSQNSDDGNFNEHVFDTPYNLRHAALIDPPTIDPFVRQNNLPHWQRGQIA